MKNEINEPAVKYGYISPEEYLEMARDSKELLEYFDGHIEVKAAASIGHAQISSTLLGEIGSFLKGKPCYPLGGNVIIHSPKRDSYVIPDMTIVCSEILAFEDESLGNPTVVFEIMSRSSRSADKKFKALYYQRIPYLKEYVMIDSTKRFAEVLRKNKLGEWEPEITTSQNGALYIKSIDFRISFDEIYRRTGL